MWKEENGDKTKEIVFGTLSAIDFVSKKKNPRVHKNYLIQMINNCPMGNAVKE